MQGVWVQVPLGALAGRTRTRERLEFPPASGAGERGFESHRPYSVERYCDGQVVERQTHGAQTPGPRKGHGSSNLPLVTAGGRNRARRPRCGWAEVRPGFMT